MATTAYPPMVDGTMVPTPDILPQVLPTPNLNERGRPVGQFRDELRRINNGRNALTVAIALIQSVGLVVAAGYLNTWWAYLGAFVFMARGHVCLNILAHEAAHRMLFSNRTANDLVGRWGVGYLTFQAMLGYRRAHNRHHRDEFGPEEPDLALYSGYPIMQDSWKRKLRRDAVGISAWKGFKGLYFAAKKGRTEARQIIGLHVVLAGLSVAVMRPLVYVVWILSFSTLWKVSNRLRAVAEHGGLERSKDRRLTSRVVRQTIPMRFWMTPYNTGWHLAHHVDMSVPWRNLPRLHNELVASGWVTEELEWPSYWAFWKACSSGAEPDRSAQSSGNSWVGD